MGPNDLATASCSGPRWPTQTDDNHPLHADAVRERAVKRTGSEPDIGPSMQVEVGRMVGVGEKHTVSPWRSLRPFELRFEN